MKKFLLFAAVIVAFMATSCEELTDDITEDAEEVVDDAILGALEDSATGTSGQVKTVAITYPDDDYGDEAISYVFSYDDEGRVTKIAGTYSYIAEYDDAVSDESIYEEVYEEVYGDYEEVEGELVDAVVDELEELSELVDSYTEAETRSSVATVDREKKNGTLELIKKINAAKATTRSTTVETGTFAYTYTYSGTTMYATVTVVDDDSESSAATITLNSDGTIGSFVYEGSYTHSSETVTYTDTYNYSFANGYMTAVTDMFVAEDGTDQLYSYDFDWNDGNLVETVMTQTATGYSDYYTQSYEYTYGSALNDSSLDLAKIFIFSDEFNSGFDRMLFGEPTTNLITSEVDTWYSNGSFEDMRGKKYEYGYTSGAVTSITMSKTDWVYSTSELEAATYYEDMVIEIGYY